MTDELMDFLVDDEEEAEEIGSRESWKVMIIDDDPSVHEATKFSLSGFRFMDKDIEWVSAYSAKEARLLFENETDVALLFLDVVMEEDDAGLSFARWYREQNINPSSRIILRTGQPGQAPEKEIIVKYDLHDYKTKTELTSDKLFTTTVAALRAYHDMSRLEETRKGLEGVISSASNIMAIQTMNEYARAVLQQIDSVLDIGAQGIICAQKHKNDEWDILAETGEFKQDRDYIFSVLNKMDETSDEINEDWMVKPLVNDQDTHYAIYLEPMGQLNAIQVDMLSMFCNNVSAGMRNIRLYDSLMNANRITVMSLAQVTESRDSDTGNHVFRIAKATELLAEKLQDMGAYPDEFSPDISMYLGLSSTLHDVGKVAVRDNILLKPGRLTDEEFEEIKLHTVNGASILEKIIDAAGEDIRYLEIGKEIARHHHERWDGKGYPDGLKEFEIPLEARITAVIDVFDALTHERCYKEAFSIEEAQKIIVEGRGTQFDPLIVDAFNEIIDEIAKADDLI